jgi:hypothetical protein
MGKMTSIEGHPKRKEVWRRNIRLCAFIPGGETSWPQKNKKKIPLFNQKKNIFVGKK